MKTLKLMLGLIFIATTLHAQSSPLSSHPARKGPADLKALDQAFQAQVEESGTLFFLLTEEQASAGKELEFRISLNGRPLLEEKITLQRGASKTPAFELLAREPETLARVRGLQERPSNQVTIAVALDGQILYESSFAELVEYNRTLWKGPFQPQAVESKVRSFAPGLTGHAKPAAREKQALSSVPVQKAASCPEQCSENYQWCLENVCHPQGTFFCEECDQEYESCMSSCPPPPCTDPKSVRDYTVTQLVGYGWTGYSQCLESVFENDFYDGEWYDEYQFVYKNTRIRRTEYCDGTVTETVLWVTYSYFYCNRPAYWTCYYPWTWEYNVCY